VNCFLKHSYIASQNLTIFFYWNKIASPSPYFQKIIMKDIKHDDILSYACITMICKLLAFSKGPFTIIETNNALKPLKCRIIGWRKKLH
jgi:hypothetical protein